MSEHDNRSGNRPSNFSRRGVLLGGTAAAAATARTEVPCPTPAQAQEVLPLPPAPFKGKIGTTYKDSVPDKIPLTKAPNGAPNVLIVLIDDCGYGQWGTFGGQVPTPNLDRLAKAGLRYTRFHTTALCCTNSRRSAHRPQSSNCAGSGLSDGAGRGLPGYNTRSRRAQHHRRWGPRPSAARLQHVVVRQEPQHSRLGKQAS